jgi:hypothetical protein
MQEVTFVVTSNEFVTFKIAVKSNCMEPLQLKWLLKVGSYCLALYYYDYLENIGFVYPVMSMIVIGHSLLY